MIGWNQPVETDDRRFEGQQETGNVISVVVSRDFPEPELIREVLSKGAQAEPDAIWIIRGKPIKGDALQIAVDTLRENGAEPLFAETNRTYWGNSAIVWRDSELVHLCRLCLVFHDVNSTTTKWFADKSSPKIHVITRGVKRPPKKKKGGRKPIGA